MRLVHPDRVWDRVTGGPINVSWPTDGAWSVIATPETKTVAANPAIVRVVHPDGTFCRMPIGKVCIADVRVSELGAVRGVHAPFIGGACRRDRIKLEDTERKNPEHLEQCPYSQKERKRKIMCKYAPVKRSECIVRKMERL